ncbi:hypothetical protein ACU4GR_11885 [Methylobacterium oryzae CBMB20]
MFTLGGYGITKAGRHADELSEFLGALFLIVALLAGVAELVQLSTGVPVLFPDRPFCAPPSEWARVGASDRQPVGTAARASPPTSPSSPAASARPWAEAAGHPRVLCADRGSLPEPFVLEARFGTTEVQTLSDFPNLDERFAREFVQGLVQSAIARGLDPAARLQQFRTLQQAAIAMSRDPATVRTAEQLVQAIDHALQELTLVKS